MNGQTQAKSDKTCSTITVRVLGNKAQWYKDCSGLEDSYPDAIYVFWVERRLEVRLRRAGCHVPGEETSWMGNFGWQAELNSTLFLDYTLLSIVISSCHVTIALLGQEGLNPFPFFCTRNTSFHRHDTWFCKRPYRYFTWSWDIYVAICFIRFYYILSIITGL